MLFPIRVGRDVVPLGGEYFVDEDGFRSSTPVARQRTLADIAPASSLVILGEPGIGKSWALRELTGGDDSVIRVSLDTVADVHELRARLAALDSVVPEGGAADRVSLVVDSIDECPIPTKILAHHLEAALSRQRRPRRVLLGCRTADWPEMLGNRLRTLQPGLEVVELLPLGRTEIGTLATTRGVDGDAFLAAVVDAGAASLAALPLTLDLLLTTYQQAGRLPRSAVELYERGLLRLVEDPDPDRAPTKRLAGGASQRLAVAAKLAAYTMLCGRTAIAREAPADDHDLLASALAAGIEPIDGGDLSVTDELVTATLATALFTGRGPGRLAVVHASIAAYLTARYLTTHDVPEHQLRALITRTNSLGRTRVPSRLRETAAWLVALDPVRNDWLVDVDPDTLAAHAGLVNVDAVRRALVAYLLDSPNLELLTARRRWRLAHAGLADQLRPALRAPLTQDAGPDLGHPVARRSYVGVEIARRSREHGSVSDLVDLVLSRTTNSTLRSAAAYALRDLEPLEAARTLRVVLDEVTAHPDHDPDDQLRGLALDANWPASLTAAELVAALTQPQRSDLIGAYELFLDGFLRDVDDRAITELVRAIAPIVGSSSNGGSDDWVDEEDAPHDTSPAASPSLLTGTQRGVRAMTALLSRALDSTQLTGMVDEVGWLLAATVRHHHNIISLPARLDHPYDEEESETRDLRRSLLLATLRHVPADMASYAIFSVRGGRTSGLVTGADLAWLFSLGGTEWAAHAARLIRHVYDPADVAQQEVAWTHRGESLLDDSVGPWFDAVDLNSPRADAMRQEHKWALRQDRTWDGAAAHELALRAAWASCEQAEPDGFLRLCELLPVDPETGHSTDEYDVRSWPGFALLRVDEEVLAASAARYLHGGDASHDGWLDHPGRLPRRAVVGYVALAYLARRPDGDIRLDALTKQVWQRWTPAVLWCSVLGDQSVAASLKNAAQQHAPDTYQQWRLRRIEEISQAGWLLDPLEDIAAGYNEQIGDRLDAVLRGAVDTMARTVAELNMLQTLSLIHSRK